MPARIHRENVVGLRKAREAFVFFYDDEDSGALIRTILRFAADPEMNLSWSEAAELIRDVELQASENSGRHV
jgi:hypothetical protein